MLYYKQKTLGIVGAGPKGIAVAIKAKVLEEFGYPVDRVILIEKNGAGANWSGNFGYTNGKMKLGTSPEKDVVFPIETDVGDVQMNERIHKRLLQFTWTAFLVQTHRFSDWVDRGRPAPCHQLWSLYLQWVSEQLKPEASIVKAEVVGIDLSIDNNQWELTLKGSSIKTLSVDRLMLTGPGKTRKDFLVSDNGQLTQEIYDLESFWSALITKKFSAKSRIAIIGAGENAASVLLALSEYSPELRIDIISPKGFISTRAEGFYENQIYSQPERNHWKNIELSDRIDFIERTDLGVFSTHAMSILNEQIQHHIVPGRVIGVHNDGASLLVQVEYGKQVTTRNYDQIILATGFDQISMLKSILSKRALKVLEESVGSPLIQREIASLIQSDLSIKNMKPSLHLPMLAGLMQGPGFGNLSCLGRLSDRIVIPSIFEKNKYNSSTINALESTSTQCPNSNSDHCDLSNQIVQTNLSVQRIQVNSLTTAETQKLFEKYPKQSIEIKTLNCTLTSSMKSSNGSLSETNIINNVEANS